MLRLTSIINQENVPQVCLQANLMDVFSQLWIPLPARPNLVSSQQQQPKKQSPEPPNLEVNPVDNPTPSIIVNNKYSSSSDLGAFLLYLPEVAVGHPVILRLDGVLSLEGERWRSHLAGPACCVPSGCEHSVFHACPLNRTSYSGETKAVASSLSMLRTQ